MSNVPDPRKFAPSTARNREPIFAVLSPLLGDGAGVLEIASGAGEHALFIARRRPSIRWQPSDPSAESRASIDAHRAHEALANVAAAVALDVTAPAWPVSGPFDAVVCINMVHIAPWEATLALCEGAARVLRRGGLMYLYGPYKRGGVHTAPSNAAFDENLRGRDARWGVRDLEAVVQAAAAHGFVLENVVEMPANNLSVILRLPAAAG